MKSIFMSILAIFITIICLPILLIQGCDVHKPKVIKEPIVESNQVVRVYIHETGEIKTLDLEEYIKGVVAGEMPAAFQMEALKAQAVAARSYAVSRINAYGKDGHPSHPGAELCDSVHCQVWLSKEKLRKLKAKNWMKDYWPKIEKAVDETKGMIMTYDNEPIKQPLFHSTSGGKTENSEDVFAAWVPYLRSVESPYEERAPHLEDEQKVLVSNFIKKIKNKYSDCNIEPSSISSVKILERSEGGRVLKIQVGNKVLTGREIRELLGLRSANFKIVIEGENIKFITNGYGHGVGMSQWGANGMAERGHTFDEILKHYYIGVDISKMNP
ncbi:stage II sporulation protein D [Crassaminicella profunda]|uniref:stage II sporulation protein D n=1 Tax=Crassaminicella profunda TaxID=1286698 RepID=UPI001CA765B8|nr:stage II sporulation protein D [Crassaminicella profunda]QZY55532.1 stage II sporulation protein D [Crassaminicella profunda]